MGYTYTVVLERQHEGGYVVVVPSLHGCMTEGQTVEEALAMARDLIPLFVATLQDLGEPVPDDDPRVTVDMSGKTEALIVRLTVPARVGPPGAESEPLTVAGRQFTVRVARDRKWRSGCVEELSGCGSQGRTRAELRAMLADAIEAYLIVRGDTPDGATASIAN